MQPFYARITPLAMLPSGAVSSQRPLGLWGGWYQPFPGWKLPNQPPEVWGDATPYVPPPAAVSTKLPLPEGAWGAEADFRGWSPLPPELTPPTLPPILSGVPLLLLYVPGKGWRIASIPTPLAKK